MTATPSTPGRSDTVGAFTFTNPDQSAPPSMAEDLAYLAARCFSVSVSVNDDRGCYQTVKDSLEGLMGADFLDLGDFESAEDLARCIELNHLVRVQAYTVTAGGFFVAVGSDLARTVARCAAMVREGGEIG
ncbi:MAG: hypothetical protein K2X91_04045 [Thermoleophilia bacterium]|nr:hypothetical protein [Thermoleophilia bacterium]